MLPSEKMVELEQSLRDSDSMRQRLSRIAQRRDHGVHSVGEIWRRQRLSCPDREKLGSYLLDVLPADHREYIEFHLYTVGCRLCNANLNDLEQSVKATPEAQRRRRKFFQSSAGYLSQMGHSE
ncbi:MAG: hypothetical protein CMJ78_12415 [Planctomycetaceae bacterium]|nr:hypothetical protein [Planctomycetaceae bacterium]